MAKDIEKIKLLATTIRILSAEAVQKANSGHPGMPMGAADYAAVLWAQYMNFNPKDPNWANRDRFVLSSGHGSMLLYSLLHIFGFNLPMEQLKQFRQWGSITPGHPEFHVTPGVECTTGPLGQGFANGVGMAMSGKLLQARYSEKLFNHKVFGIVSDGDLMEGVSCEAASFAGHLELGNLIYFYDDNEISIGGNTNVTFTESVPKRFESYGWNVLDIDGHDISAIAQSLDSALKGTGKPTIICAHSTIGFGSPKKQGTSHVHGEPLGVDELNATKKNLGWNYDAEFFIPPEVGEYCCKLTGEKTKVYDSWQKEFNDWSGKNESLAAQYKAQISKTVPVKLKEDLISTFREPKKEASRNLSGTAIQVLAKHLPGFIGGSADLEPSTKTLIKDSTDIQPNKFSGKNIRFGVREHGMGAIANGLSYSGPWVPFTATFLVFADYMRPTLRLAALSHIQTQFIFTHESFWVGEDGPTHEPIEQIMSLRLIPNLYVFRPCDGMEVGMCYLAALNLKERPSVHLFTRQNLEPIERRKDFTPEDIMKGGYVAVDRDGFNLVIVATGSEVALGVAAGRALESKGIKARVVSLPSWELFHDQGKAYCDSVIPPGIKKVSIEAGTTFGWEKIVGSDSLRIGIDHYGASAPGALLAEKFGFVPDAVTAKISKWLGV